MGGIEEKGAEAHGAAAEKLVFEGFNGLVMSETMTKIGNEFFEQFCLLWEPPTTGLNGYYVLISEKASPMWGTWITVSVDDVAIWSKVLKPRSEEIEPEVEEARAIVYEYVSNYEQYQMQTEDMAGTGDRPSRRNRKVERESVSAGGRSMKRKWICVLAGGVCLALAAAGVGIANELIWTPINPSFGGNPANGSWLLASAQAQNTMVPKSTGYTRPDPLADFEYSLKRQYLTRLADRIMDDIFGEDTLLPSGDTDAEYTIGDYHVQISTLGSVKVTITDTITGSETAVEVPYY